MIYHNVFWVKGPGHEILIIKLFNLILCPQKLWSFELVGCDGFFLSIFCPGITEFVDNKNIILFDDKGELAKGRFHEVMQDFGSFKPGSLKEWHVFHKQSTS